MNDADDDYKDLEQQYFALQNSWDELLARYLKLQKHSRNQRWALRQFNREMVITMQGLAHRDYVDARARARIAEASVKHLMARLQPDRIWRTVVFSVLVAIGLAAIARGVL